MELRKRNLSQVDFYNLSELVQRDEPLLRIIQLARHKPSASTQLASPVLWSGPSLKAQTKPSVLDSNCKTNLVSHKSLASTNEFSALPVKIESKEINLKSLCTSRGKNAYSMKTQLIRFNSKVFGEKRGKMETRLVKRSGEKVNGERKGRPKETLEILVFSQRNPRIHLNVF